MESPAKGHKKSGNLKSRIKAFLSNLTPIRRTVAFVVILFHVFLLCCLTLTILNILSLSVSPQASPKFQDGESRLLVNISSYTDSNLPNRGVSNVSPETHGSLAKKGVLNTSSTTHNSLPIKGGPNFSPEAHGSLAKKGALNTSSATHSSLPNKDVPNTSSKNHSSLAKEEVFNISWATNGSFSNKGTPNSSMETRGSLAKEGVSNVSPETHHSLAKQGVSNISMETRGSFAKEGVSNVSPETHHSLAKQGVSNMSSKTHNSFSNIGVTSVSLETPSSWAEEEVLNISSTNYGSLRNKDVSNISLETNGNLAKEDRLNISSNSFPNKDVSNTSSKTSGSLAKEGESNVSSTTYLPNSGCDFGQIYVYDLPTMFNYDITNNCTEIDPPANKCDKNMNDGLGPMATEFAGMLPESIIPTFYWTDTFWGEVLFHNRILNHKCRTLNPESATAFYIPFYAGLGLTRYLFTRPARERDRLPEMLDAWLQDQIWWKRSNGSDHITMLGRITWDFRRRGAGYDDAEWGSRFLLMPAMQNVVHLSIEKNEWDGLEIAVPYPSIFHPRSESDVVEWQEFVTRRRRSHLYTFVGGGRSQIRNDFRGILKEECLRDSTACRHVDCGSSSCADGKTAVMAAFLDADFCLQPRGDSMTRRSVFDCMLAGSIPVFFWRGTAYSQYEFSIMPDEPESYSVFIDRDDVRNGTDIRRVLEGFGREEVERMREKVIEHIPRIMYAKSMRGLEKTRDAFDVVIDGVLSKYKDHMARGRLGDLNEL